MSGTVLCGIGDSNTDAHVVRAAIEISERLELRLVLTKIVHVSARQSEEFDGEAFWRQQRGARAMLAQLVNDFDLGRRVERRVVVGDTAESLARIAADEAATMIVIGDRRRRLLRVRSRQLAVQLHAATRVPVVLVPRAATTESIALRAAEIGV